MKRNTKCIMHSDTKFPGQVGYYQFACEGQSKGTTTFTTTPIDPNDKVPRHIVWFAVADDAFDVLEGELS